jgi:two-component system sensor histidine kinase PilS (NtrC family)
MQSVEASPAPREAGQVLRVLAFRLAIVTGLFALMAYLGWRGELRLFSALTVFPVIVVLYSISALYAIVLRRQPKGNWFLYFQFFVDAFCIAMLLHRTGGSLGNPFSVLFVFNILGAGVLLMLPGALTVATVNSSVFLLLVWSDLRADPIAWGASGTYEQLINITQVAVHLLGFYLTAFVSGFQARAGFSSARALAALRELHDHVVRSLSAGVITLDNEGRVTSANPASERVLGVQREEMLDRRIGDLIPGPSPTAELRALQTGEQDVHDDRPQRWESWTECLDGRRRYLRFVLSDVRDQDGLQVGRSLVVDDLSELRTLEERSRRDERLAAVGRLSASIAHEIRNPLTAISGSMQVLEQTAEGDERRLPLVRIIHSETARLNRLVENFLSLSKRPTGERQSVDVSDLVESVLQIVSHDPRFQRVDLERDLREVPPVLGNADALRQLFLNLAINAAQAMPGGGRMSARVGSTPEAVVVEFEDEGGGVRTEDKERIFDPFFTAREGGTGLGLALAAAVVEDHLGELRVEDGRAGALFVVELPLARPRRKAEVS